MTGIVAIEGMLEWRCSREHCSQKYIPWRGWQGLGAFCWLVSLVGMTCLPLSTGQELPLDGNQATGALFYNPSSDPLGDVDSYKMLQQADVEGQWSKDDGRNATEKMQDVMSFSSVLHVDVKLVGFDGDGNYDLKVDEADFLRYFETVLEEHEKVCANSMHACSWLSRKEFCRCRVWPGTFFFMIKNPATHRVVGIGAAACPGIRVAIL